MDTCREAQCFLLGQPAIVGTEKGRLYSIFFLLATHAGKLSVSDASQPVMHLCAGPFFFVAARCLRVELWLPIAMLAIASEAACGLDVHLS
jgi:hypothetical protein